MRYSQESTTSALNLENSAQSSSVLNLYSSGPPPVYSQPPSYQSESSNNFYPPTSHIFPSLDVRRLGTTSNNSASGMAHSQRAQLPHPGPQASTRELFGTSASSFRRTEHPARSPTFAPGFRRHPLSPTPSPNQTFTPPFKMDSSFGAKATQSIPPLGDMTMLGNLQYTESNGATGPIKVEINGTIDKGFFLADNEWTCYRRNYFSCICSFSLMPHFVSTTLTFVESSTSRSHAIQGFAMSISAVVSDNDGHVIELVQHTPKRDKGPTARPEKMRLKPKPLQASHHNISMYGPEATLPTSSRYEHAYAPPQAAYPTEHTFERIQFKQATANNGKRRAAQQYYHLLVELWADVGGADPFVRIAYRKSAKMIVRGRSPGHYQSERRGSTSSGPGGGSAGSLGYPGSQMGPEFGPSGSTLLPGAYGNSYDPRPSNHYGSGVRHHQHPNHPSPPHPQSQSQPQHQHSPSQPPPPYQAHAMDVDHNNHSMSNEELKAITETKEYQYYPTPICESTNDPRQPVEMFSHSSHRNESDQVLPQIHTSPGELLGKVKADPGSHDSPHLFYAGSSFYSNRCSSRFEGKSSSSGYYPTPLVPTSSISMP